MKKSRNTQQKEIISSILKTKKGLFSTQELFENAKKRDSSIGIATIYRFLKELKRKNQIHSYICNRKTLYSKEKSSHCHYICEKTRKIIHFDIKNLDFLKNISLPGTIDSIQLEIRGICKNCK